MRERTKPLIAPTAPFRASCPPGKLVPLMRVLAENSTPWACLRSISNFAPNFSAKRIIDLPSGVSSKILAAKATLAISDIE